MRKVCCVMFLLIALVSSAAAAKKVIYFTHQPGRWHQYTPQLKAFKEVAKKAGWELTVMTGSYKDQVAKLRVKDFAKGFDAVVYNFCFAASKDLEACSNLMKQTTENGVPAFLIHCSMHSFWDTYKNGKKGSVEGSEAKAKPELIKDWKTKNPGKPFPVWGDFTGVASTGHGPKKPITCIKVKEHAATKRLPADFVTINSELYNNAYITSDVTPILKGKQGKKEAVIMWTAPRGKSEVMGLTLGHSTPEWNDEHFQNLLIDSVNYLAREKK